MNRQPVKLFDADGGSNFFIEKEVVPELLKVIENSGLSYTDAKKIPSVLSVALEAMCAKKLSSTCFSVTPE